MKYVPVLQLQHVTKTIKGRKIVDDLSFDIKQGEVFGFLGPNGAGKTTTIRMMVGLIKMSKGDIIINGYSINKDFNKAIQHVGAIVENPDLYKYLTGYENLKHYARMSKNVSKRRIDEIAEVVGLKDKIHEKVSTYSLGMRQRLGIAQALLHRPSLLILDEPTNGLDPSGIHELRNYIKTLAHEEGIGVLVSSHLLLDMELMCDRVGVLKNGKLVEVREIKDFIGNEDISSISIMVEPSQIELARQIIKDLNQPALLTKNKGTLMVHMNKSEVPMLNKKFTDGGVQVYGIQIKEKTLEDKFLEVTEGEKWEN